MTIIEQNIFKETTTIHHINFSFKNTYFDRKNYFDVVDGYKQP